MLEPEVIKALDVLFADNENNLQNTFIAYFAQKASTKLQPLLVALCGEELQESCLDMDSCVDQMITSLAKLMWEHDYDDEQRYITLENEYDAHTMKTDPNIEYYIKGNYPRAVKFDLIIINHKHA
jgi:hypothetical protein